MTVALRALPVFSVGVTVTVVPDTAAGKFAASDDSAPTVYPSALAAVQAIVLAESFAANDSEVGSTASVGSLGVGVCPPSP